MEIDKNRKMIYGNYNNKFIRNQFEANKPFYFSHNPNDIEIVVQGSFYEQEIELLRQLVKQKYNKIADFKEITINNNKYWKLEW